MLSTIKIVMLKTIGAVDFIRNIMETTKKDEFKAFLFITVFLFPLLSIAIVGGLGFAIWFSQMIFGPPGI